MEERYDKAYTGRLLDLTLLIGASLLRSGAEISRVEDTMQRICRSCGAEQVDAFVITSLISLTVHMEGGRSMSQTRRIGGSSNHLRRIEELNALSRDICAGQCSLEQAEQRAFQITQEKEKNQWLIYLGAALAAGGFAVFFGGGAMDCLVAAEIGLVMILAQENTPPWMNAMVQVAVVSFLAGLTTLLVSRVLTIHTDAVMIGEIMLLIPGLSWGTALRELLTGDTISGSLRFIQSLLLSVMIALGFAASYYLMGGGV